MNEQAKRNQELGYYLHKVVALLDKRADSILRQNAGISLSQFLILLTADKQSGLSLSQQEIADHLGINKAAVSRHLNTLVQHKLILRETHPVTRQANTISITSAGVKLLRQAQIIMQKTMTPHYDRALNEDEGLLRALKVLHDSLARDN